MHELTANTQIIISLNPASYQVSIQAAEKLKSLVCTNYLGEHLNVTVENNSVDILDLSNEIYFLKITTENGHIITKKL